MCTIEDMELEQEQIKVCKEIFKSSGIDLKDERYTFLYIACRISKVQNLSEISQIIKTIRYIRNEYIKHLYFYGRDCLVDIMGGLGEWNSDFCTQVSIFYTSIAFDPDISSPYINHKKAGRKIISLSSELIKICRKYMRKEGKVKCMKKC